jgi:hypothetical protein
MADRNKPRPRGDGLVNALLGLSLAAGLLWWLYLIVCYVMTGAVPL